MTKAVSLEPPNPLSNSLEQHLYVSLITAAERLGVNTGKSDILYSEHYR